MPTRKARRMMGLTIRRVDLVDAGASIDKSTGEGAHIMIFKRDPEADAAAKTGLLMVKGKPLKCGSCDSSLPTRYSESGMELPNYCPECGASIDLTATGGDMEGDDVEKAKWTAAFINSLPDSSFAVIAPGGKKDSEGKTAPRALRHLPYKDAGGKVDLPHLRNALSRLPQTKISADLKARAKAKLEAAARAAGIGSGTKKQEGAMTEVKIDASWPQEAKDAIAALQAQVTPDPAADDPEVVKASLTPEARRLVEKAESDARAAREETVKTNERVAKLENERKVEDFRKRAAVHKALPSWTAEKGGQLLLEVAEKCSKETVEALDTILKAANDAITTGRLFGEVGADGGAPEGSEASAAITIQKLAEAHFAKGATKTLDEAREFIIRSRPDLYARHRDEVTVKVSPSRS